MPWAPDYIDAVDGADYLRIDDDDDNVLLAIAISASSRAIDDECNRQFGRVDEVEERTYTPYWSSRLCRWVLSIDDLMTTDDLVVSIADGGDAITEYELTPTNELKRGRPWTALEIKRSSTVQPRAIYHERVTISAWWGWTAQPDQLDQAIRLQLSRLHFRRDSPTGVAGSPDSGSEIRLLAKLDPDVKVALRGLVRTRRPR